MYTSQTLPTKTSVTQRATLTGDEGFGVVSIGVSTLCITPQFDVVLSLGLQLAITVSTRVAVRFCSYLKNLVLEGDASLVETKHAITRRPLLEEWGAVCDGLISLYTWVHLSSFPPRQCSMGLCVLFHYIRGDYDGVVDNLAIFGREGICKMHDDRCWCYRSDTPVCNILGCWHGAILNGWCYNKEQQWQSIPPDVINTVFILQ